MRLSNSLYDLLNDSYYLTELIFIIGGKHFTYPDLAGKI
jgi:hypothetical protein